MPNITEGRKLFNQQAEMALRGEPFPDGIAHLYFADCYRAYLVKTKLAKLFEMVPVFSYFRKLMESPIKPVNGITFSKIPRAWGIDLQEAFPIISNSALVYESAREAVVLRLQNTKNTKELTYQSFFALDFQHAPKRTDLSWEKSASGANFTVRGQKDISGMLLIASALDMYFNDGVFGNDIRGISMKKETLGMYAGYLKRIQAVENLNELLRFVNENQGIKLGAISLNIYNSYRLPKRDGVSGPTMTTKNFDSGWTRCFDISALKEGMIFVYQYYLETLSSQEKVLEDGTIESLGSDMDSFPDLIADIETVVAGVKGGCFG